MSPLFAFVLQKCNQLKDKYEDGSSWANFFQRKDKEKERNSIQVTQLKQESFKPSLPSQKEISSVKWFQSLKVSSVSFSTTVPLC